MLNHEFDWGFAPCQNVLKKTFLLEPLPRNDVTVDLVFVLVKLSSFREFQRTKKAVQFVFRGRQRALRFRGIKEPEIKYVHNKNW